MRGITTNINNFHLLEHKHKNYAGSYYNNFCFLNIKSYLFRSVIILLFLFTSFSISTRGASDNSTNDIDPSKSIIHHVENSYSWIVFKDLSIYLPVILLTDKGLDIFSSKRISSSSFRGKYYNYILSHGRIKSTELTNKGTSPILIDLSITKNVASMFFVSTLMLILFISTAYSYKKNGKCLKGLASIIEPFIIFVRDEIAKPNIGTKNYQKYVPFLLTLFFFICINNLVGLIPVPPGNVNATGNISVTIALGLISFIVVNFSGNKHYWKHILKPDVPFYLLPIMILVEFIGVLSKPFALIVRLFANITAGHIIILSLIFLIFILKSFIVAPISILFVLFMYILELLVAFLQAYIFTLLTALFIGGATSTNKH